MAFRSVPIFQVAKVLLLAAVCALFGPPALLAQGAQAFKGQITQCACPGRDKNSTAVEKGIDATPCGFPCLNAGTTYFLADLGNRAALQLDKQDFARAYAGRVVYVIGNLDKSSSTIHVNNIVPDLPAIVKQAKTASIVCDACPRAMAKAKLAAFEEMTTWKRFTLVSDPKTADLVFLFSANPYLGDYITRDGPDKRITHVETTYMNVVDPHTGHNLWGDSEKVGYFFVGSSTKDLINELRELMEADVSSTERKLFVARNLVPKVPLNMGK